MPSTLPAALAAVAEWLSCPACGRPLAPRDRTLTCTAGHVHDIARQGYVNLTGPSGGPAGDDAAMIAQRMAVLGAGHFAPLTATLARLARQASPAPELVLDTGAGTGHHLAGVLDALPGACGVAVDASPAAARRAARAHPRAASVVGDVWTRIPLIDGAADLALCVFAPRSGAELARVMAPGGRVLVTAPDPTHLRELAPLLTVGIAADKPAALARALEPWWKAAATVPVRWSLSLSTAEVSSLVGMGPSARHASPGRAAGLSALSEPVAVSAAVDVRVYIRS